MPERHKVDREKADTAINKTQLVDIDRVHLDLPARAAPVDVPSGVTHCPPAPGRVVDVTMLARLILCYAMRRSRAC